MKRLFAVILLSVLFCASAFAYDFSAVCESGQMLCYNITSDVEPYTVEVFKSPAYNITGDLIIPESVVHNGINYSVTSIGYYAFGGCGELTTITIPNSVTNFDDYAFSLFEGRLDAVYYTGDVAGWCGITFGNGSANPLDIAHNLYIDNNLVTDIIIPETITKIKAYTFFGATCLTSLTIPNSVTSIGNSAFFGCTGLTSVTIGNGVTSIGTSAFGGCNGLSSITIPDNVTNIGNFAFRECSGLESITIGNSVRSIGCGAFGFCCGLNTINFNATNSSINYSNDEDNNEDVFFHCYADATINIGDNVTIIPDCAFRGLQGRGTLTIPNSVTRIGDYAFYNCSGLTLVTIPNSIESIGDYAFAGCNVQCNEDDNALYIGNEENQHFILYKAASSDILSCNINDNCKYINSSAFSGCTELASITIPNSVTSIGGYAFYNCSSLTSVTIPNSVTRIGSGAFYRCSGITEPLYNANCFAYFPSDYATEYTIPDGIWQVVGMSFRGCGSLQSITIPNTVTHIDSSAFYGCSGLASVTIPNSVTHIGISAFSRCDGLTSVTIPSSVTNMGIYAFGWCNRIETVNFNATNCTRMYCVFRDCPWLRILKIGENVTHIPFDAFGSDGYEECPLTEIYSYSTNPPEIYRWTFAYNHYNNASVFVPCNAVDNYTAAENWSYFTNIQGSKYMLYVASDYAMGIARVVQAPDCTDGTAIISASPLWGYRFVQWDDGNTDNPRTVVVSDDSITYTALFEVADDIEEKPIDEEFDLYPNPVSNTLHITSLEEISEIEIVNMMGQVVLQMDVDGDNAVCDVENLPSGVYVVKVRALRQAQGATLRKFVKE
jgi:hypothetical protein